MYKILLYKFIAKIIYKSISIIMLSEYNIGIT